MESSTPLFAMKDVLEITPSHLEIGNTNPLISNSKQKEIYALKFGREAEISVMQGGKLVIAQAYPVALLVAISSAIADEVNANGPKDVIRKVVFHDTNPAALRIILQWGRDCVAAGTLANLPQTSTPIFSNKITRDLASELGVLPLEEAARNAYREALSSSKGYITISRAEIMNAKTLTGSVGDETRKAIITAIADAMWSGRFRGARAHDIYKCLEELPKFQHDLTVEQTARTRARQKWHQVKKDLARSEKNNKVIW